MLLPPPFPISVDQLDTAFLGAALVSRQSRGAFADVQTEFASGRFPGKSLAHGAMILVAGAITVNQLSFTFSPRQNIS